MVGQPPRVDLPLGSIADLQGGVVTRAQARAAGLLRSEIGYLARRSAWEPIRRGMYAEPGGGASVRIGSALLATGSRGVASHGSAAALLGLDLLRDPDATQTVLTVRPGQRGHRDLDGIRVHRAGLPPWHVSELNGLPVTTVARTLVDLTRALSLRDGVVAMDAALHSGRVRLEQLEEVLADCRGWPWIRRAASAVKLTDPAAESALESLSRIFFCAHDIPAPRTQFVVRSGQRFIARTDFWWEKPRVAGEADGLGKYAALADLHAEKLRQERIEALGIRVVRWTWGDIWQPAAARATAARLRAILSRAA